MCSSRKRYPGRNVAIPPNGDGRPSSHHQDIVPNPRFATDTQLARQLELCTRGTANSVTHPGTGNAK